MWSGVMLPRKHARSETTTFLNQELMKLQFQEHDLKFRTSNGQYKYFRCSKCNLRVGMKCSSTDSCVSCRNSQLNQPCCTAEVVPVVDTTTVAGIATVAVVQLCVACRNSECMYACAPCMHKSACRSCASQSSVSRNVTLNSQPLPAWGQQPTSRWYFCPSPGIR